MIKSSNFRGFRGQTISSFLYKHSVSSEIKIPRGEKVKLCSSDDFNAVAKGFEEKYNSEKGPIIISNVGGFYVMASLLGNAASKCKTKPYALFFDKKHGNTLNGLYNSLLVKMCDTKEGYIKYLFGIDDIDLVKAVSSSLYNEYIIIVLSEEDEKFKKLSKKDQRLYLPSLYKKDQERIDKIIYDRYIKENHFLKKSILENFDISKIVKYCQNKEYDVKKHFDMLISKAEKKFRKEDFKLFVSCAEKMTNYLSQQQNYKDLVAYLSKDIKINKKYHILANDEIYRGFKSLFNVKGSYIKFAQGIDISSSKGVQKLISILQEESFVNEEGSKLSIDLAFIPHINVFKDIYPFLKGNVQNYVMLSPERGKNNRYFFMDDTATLDIRTLSSIGGDFIKKERDIRIGLTKNIDKISAEKGFPLMMFIAGANYGNIYHSEPDTQNMVDLAIANKVDTVFIQGFFYSTYYHYQTSRRMLTDPTYPTLSSRLQAAKAVIEKLTNAGIKVVYQMGDEEYYLYKDLFRIYTREQEVIGNDFLKREDLRSKYDWIRPIIIQYLIPYLIRSGEDVVNLYTDDSNKTSVTKVCLAIKRYIEGNPLGDFEDLIKPEFLKDTEMFKVVSSYVKQMDEENKKSILNLMSRPTYSRGPYSDERSAAIKKAELTDIGQLNVNSSSSDMSIVTDGRTINMSVPQMIRDEWYEEPGLLSGIKESVLGDPTRKRITQVSKEPNYPGGFIITGNIEEKMVILPYFERLREIMEHVQRTGEGLPLIVEGKINDWQLGSLTERPDYDIKFLDYLMYEAGADILSFNGDLIQGYNYKGFANENRHLGATSITQQMLHFNRMIEPYVKDAMGVVNYDFGPCSHLAYEIMAHLVKKELINRPTGNFGNSHTIKRGIDYKTVNLDLPTSLQPYESIIRNKLSNIKNLRNISIVEGNHEANSDWDYKGFDETQLLAQMFEGYKKHSGSDVGISYAEFIANKYGDIMQASASTMEINGYRIFNTHYEGRGSKSITERAYKWLSGSKGSLPKIDILDFGHYHLFEMAVVRGTLVHCTGHGAGTSGYEYRLGYPPKKPIYAYKMFMPDGSVRLVTIGANFLENYQIKNPYIKGRGLDNFISDCMVEPVDMLAEISSGQIQKMYSRRLKPRAPQSIGPKIPRKS